LLVVGELALQVVFLVVLAVGVAMAAFLGAMFGGFGRADTAQARAGFRRRKWFAGR
jgi:hypothetical protein